MKWTVLVAAIDVGLLWLMLGTDVIVAAPRREPAVVQAIQLTPCDVRIAQLERRVALLRVAMHKVKRHSTSVWYVFDEKGRPPNSPPTREHRRYYELAYAALSRDDELERDTRAVSVPEHAPEARP